ncbi:hypothetical protein JCM8547_001064 [Rhodosporidiobolus lusitaniae]
MSSARLAPPHHQLHSDPSTGLRSIRINGWTVSTYKKPILSIPQADALSDELDLALPEIIFGNNALVLRHNESGLEVRWDAKEMLMEVKKGEGWDAKPGAGAVSVKHADEWKRGQSASTSSTATLTVQKPYDWTYTTLHPGSYTLPSPSSSSTSSSSSSRQPAPSFSSAPPSHPGIPLAQLARTDIPILFFDEVPLFEDELGDNGIADATVRVRVNALSLYALARFSLRIDGVLFRHFDVRLFHAFPSPPSSSSSPPELVRQTKGRQAPYSTVRDRIIGPSRPSLSPASSFSTSANGASPAARRSPGVVLPSRTGYASPAGLAPGAGKGAGGGAEPAEDLSQLNDINRVAGVLDLLALEEQAGGVSQAEKGREGEGGGKESWEGLGTRLEVMQIPVRGDEGEGLQ